VKLAVIATVGLQPHSFSSYPNNLSCLICLALCSVVLGGVGGFYLVTRCEANGQLHASAALPPVKEPLVPIGLEAGWAS
jgi:hypothetical protein